MDVMESMATRTTVVMERVLLLLDAFRFPFAVPDDGLPLDAASEAFLKVLPMSDGVAGDTGSDAPRGVSAPSLIVSLSS